MICFSEAKLCLSRSNKEGKRVDLRCPTESHTDFPGEKKENKKQRDLQSVPLDLLNFGLCCFFSFWFYKAFSFFPVFKTFWGHVFAKCNIIKLWCWGLLFPLLQQNIFYLLKKKVLFKIFFQKKLWLTQNVSFLSSVIANYKAKISDRFLLSAPLCCCSEAICKQCHDSKVSGPTASLFYVMVHWSLWQV